MNKSAPISPTDSPRPASSKKKELEDAAINFAKFLYDLWRESRKNEIMEVDKTIYNEEPTNNN